MIVWQHVTMMNIPVLTYVLLLVDAQSGRKVEVRSAALAKTKQRTNKSMRGTLARTMHSH